MVVQVRAVDKRCRFRTSEFEVDVKHESVKPIFKKRPREQAYKKQPEQLTAMPFGFDQPRNIDEQNREKGKHPE